MKRGTPDHWKMDELASEIAKRWPMPAEIAIDAACGLMERLWHIAGRYAPRGDLGKMSDTFIARKVGWAGEASDLVAVLLRIRWLDPSEEFRLLVHDWPHHADDTVKKALEAGEIETFADGSPVRREKPGSKPKKPRLEEPELDLDAPTTHQPLATDSRTTRERLASDSPPSEPSLSEPSLSKEDMSLQRARSPESGFTRAERGRLRARLHDHPWALQELPKLEHDFFAYRSEHGFEDDTLDGFVRWIEAIEQHRHRDDPTKLEQAKAAEIRRQVAVAASDGRVTSLLQGIEGRARERGGGISFDDYVDRKASSG